MALAALVLAAVPLWLLDEPTTNLDSAGQELVAALLDAHLSAGGLAIAAVHHGLHVEPRARARTESRQRDAPGVTAHATVDRRAAGHRPGSAAGFPSSRTAAASAGIFHAGDDAVSAVGVTASWQYCGASRRACCGSPRCWRRLLALDFLFRDDAQDGTLEQYALSGQSLTWLLLGKTGAHWLLTGVPLSLMAPADGLHAGRASRRPAPVSC